MAFKLVISDVIDVPVKGSLKDGAGSVPFNFTLQMRRMGLEDKNDETVVSEWIRQNTSGWRGQRLVLDDADAPAAFSPEALDVLLGIAGMESFCWAAYMSALRISDTPAGRAGN